MLQELLVGNKHEMEELFGSVTVCWMNHVSKELCIGGAMHWSSCVEVFGGAEESGCWRNWKT